MATGFPVPQPPQGSHAGQWSSDLCDCFDDCGSCFVTHWCPCITFGRIAESVDKGTTSCVICGAIYCLLMSVGWQCCLSCIYRSKMRGEHRLPENPCNDFCVHCCCELCALCQEYRELKHRGYEMSGGWHGNTASQNKPMVPPTAPMMK